MLGVLWQTATMRRNFELYGDYYISLDMMKILLNKLLWLYTAVTIHDDTNHICIGLEVLVCGERFDMYLAQANFLEKHSPGRPLQFVKIVSGDGFLIKT